MMKYTCDGREVTIEELQVIFDNPYLEEVGEEPGQKAGRGTMVAAPDLLGSASGQWLFCLASGRKWRCVMADPNKVGYNRDKFIDCGAGEKVAQALAEVIRFGYGKLFSPGQPGECPSSFHSIQW